MKAKFGGQCPVCNKFFNAGDSIAKLNKPIRVHGWVDNGGRRAGQSYSNLKSWAHEECVKSQKEIDRISAEQLRDDLKKMQDAERILRNG